MSSGNGSAPQQKARTYHGILLVLNCCDGDFCKEVVMEGDVGKCDSIARPLAKTFL